MNRGTRSNENTRTTRGSIAPVDLTEEGTRERGRQRGSRATTSASKGGRRTKARTSPSSEVELLDPPSPSTGQNGRSNKRNKLKAEEERLDQVLLGDTCQENAYCFSMCTEVTGRCGDAGFDIDEMTIEEKRELAMVAEMSAQQQRHEEEFKQVVNIPESQDNQAQSHGPPQEHQHEPATITQTAPRATDSLAMENVALDMNVEENAPDSSSDSAIFDRKVSERNSEGVDSPIVQNKKAVRPLESGSSPAASEDGTRTVQTIPKKSQVSSASKTDEEIDAFFDEESHAEVFSRAQRVIKDSLQFVGTGGQVKTKTRGQRKTFQLHDSPKKETGSGSESDVESDKSGPVSGSGRTIPFTQAKLNDPDNENSSDSVVYIGQKKDKNGQKRKNTDVSGNESDSTDAPGRDITEYQPAVVTSPSTETNDDRPSRAASPDLFESLSQNAGLKDKGAGRHVSAMTQMSDSGSETLGEEEEDVLADGQGTPTNKGKHGHEEHGQFELNLSLGNQDVYDEETEPASPVLSKKTKKQSRDEEETQPFELDVECVETDRHYAQRTSDAAVKKVVTLSRKRRCSDESRPTTPEKQAKLELPSSALSKEVDIVTGIEDPATCTPVPAEAFVKLVNKRRLRRKLYERKPYYAPSPVSPGQYTKVIVARFEKWRKTLKEVQSKASNMLPWPKPVVVGRHMKDTLDQQRRGQRTSPYSFDDDDDEDTDDEIKCAQNPASKSGDFSQRPRGAIPSTSGMSYTRRHTRSQAKGLITLVNSDDEDDDDFVSLKRPMRNFKQKEVDFEELPDLGSRTSKKVESENATRARNVKNAEEKDANEIQEDPYGGETCAYVDDNLHSPQFDTKQIKQSPEKKAVGVESETKPKPYSPQKDKENQDQSVNLVNMLKRTSTMQPVRSRKQTGDDRDYQSSDSDIFVEEDISINIGHVNKRKKESRRTYSKRAKVLPARTEDAFDNIQTCAIGGPQAVPASLIENVPVYKRRRMTSSKKVVNREVNVSDFSMETVQVSDQSMKTVPVSDLSMKTVPVSDQSMKTVPVSDLSMKTVPVSDQSMKTVPVSDLSMKTVSVSDQSLETVPINDQSMKTVVIPVSSVISQAAETAQISRRSGVASACSDETMKAGDNRDKAMDVSVVNKTGSESEDSGNSLVELPEETKPSSHPETATSLVASSKNGTGAEETTCAVKLKRCTGTSPLIPKGRPQRSQQRILPESSPASITRTRGRGLSRPSQKEQVQPRSPVMVEDEEEAGTQEVQQPKSKQRRTRQSPVTNLSTEEERSRRHQRPSRQGRTGAKLELRRRSIHGSSKNSSSGDEEEQTHVSQRDAAQPVSGPSDDGVGNKEEAADPGVQCPLCGKEFPPDAIEEHASGCEGPDGDEEQDPTETGQQDEEQETCPMCSRVIPSEEYGEHVTACVEKNERKQRKQAKQSPSGSRATRLRRGRHQQEADSDTDDLENVPLGEVRNLQSYMKNRGGGVREQGRENSSSSGSSDETSDESDTDVSQEVTEEYESNENRNTDWDLGSLSPVRTFTLLSEQQDNLIDYHNQFRRPRGGSTSGGSRGRGKSKRGSKHGSKTTQGRGKKRKRRKNKPRKKARGSKTSQTGTRQSKLSTASPPKWIH